MGAGRLYVVATPIGNLEDLSPRAARVLAEVDLIAAEDTRVTRRLLARGSGGARLVSYRDENERRMTSRLLGRLRAGESVALVSDAGTPAVSDPGYRLIRAAARAGIDVVSVPGPSAMVALLSVSGLPTDRFSFEGFLPPARAARRRALEALSGAGRTVVFFESPRRIVRLLEELAGVLGDPEVAVGRELTKVHEEVLRGRASEVADLLAQRDRLRGEFTVAAYVEARSQEDAPDAEDQVRRLLEAGWTARDIAAELRTLGVSRRRVYEIVRKLSSR